MPRAPDPVRHGDRISAEAVDGDARRVIHRLNESGYASYLVGGGVRDLLLGATPKDFDVATDARPEEVRDLFRNSRIIGRRFRLVHVFYPDGKVIETATFRRDPGTRRDGSHGKRSSGGDRELLIRRDNTFGRPHEDALRRDFTINGLFFDCNTEEVIDYVDGMRDVESRTVRMIGDPWVRLREDPIRILRAIKFQARLGLNIDPPLMDAMVGLHHELANAAKPRLFEELLRLLRGGKSRKSVQILWETGSLAMMVPELSAFLDDAAAGDSAGVGNPLWSMLDQIDQSGAEGKPLDDTVLLACLLRPPLEEWLEGLKDLPVAFEEFFQPVTERLSVPRRVKDRVRSIVMAQRRLQSGKFGALRRRDYFSDAVQFFRMGKVARGESIPDWVEDYGTRGGGAGDKPVKERGRGR